MQSLFLKLKSFFKTPCTSSENTMSKRELLAFLNREDLHIRQAHTSIHETTRIDVKTDSNGQLQRVSIPVMTGRAYKSLMSDALSVTCREGFSYDKGDYKTLRTEHGGLSLANSFEVNGADVVDDDGCRMTAEDIGYFLYEGRQFGVIPRLTTILYDAFGLPHTRPSTDL
jgi:hypothetical protein